MRISTYNINTMSLGNAMKVQQEWANAITQQSSQLKSEDFRGLGAAETKTMLSLQQEIEQTGTWGALATQTGGKLEVMWSAVKGAVDQVTNLRSQIASFNSSTLQPSALAELAEQIQSALVSQLNVQYNGLFVFSGAETSTVPVDLSAYPDTLLLTADDPAYTAADMVSDASYYQGDSYAQTVRLSGSLVVDYGVRADNDSMELALRATQMVIDLTRDQSSASPNLTSAQYEERLGWAFALAEEALNGLASLQERISVDANTMKNTATTHATTLTILQESLGQVKNVDAAEATLRANNLQTQLQASYSAVGKVAQMSIVNYL